MDQYQKEVTRRKKHLVAKMLNFSEESQEMYNDFGLLDISSKELIMVRLINSQILIILADYIESVYWTECAQILRIARK